VNLAVCHANLDEWEEARAILLETYNALIEPKNKRQRARCQRLLVQTLAELGKADEAEALLPKLDGSDVQILKCRIAIARRDFARARELCGTLVNGDSALKRAAFYRLRARILEGLGENDAALDAYRRAWAAYEQESPAPLAFLEKYTRLLDRHSHDIPASVKDALAAARRKREADKLAAKKFEVRIRSG